MTEWVFLALVFVFCALEQYGLHVGGPGGYLTFNPGFLRTINYSYVFCAFFYTSILLPRLRRVPAIERIVIGPVIIASCLVGLVAAIATLAQEPQSPHTTEQTFLWQGFAVLIAPLGFLATGWLQLRKRLSITDSMVNLPKPATPEAVEEALRAALRDQSLEVFCWLPDNGHFINAEGRQVNPPDGSTGRLVLSFNSNGRPLARIATNPSLDPDHDLVKAALRASGMVLENVLLQATVSAQLNEVRQLNRRVGEVQTYERRRLQAYLHNRVQAPFRAAESAVIAAREDQSVDALQKALNAVLTLLGSGLDLIEDAQMQLYPPVLSSAGLYVAVKDFANTLHPMRIEVDIDVEYHGKPKPEHVQAPGKDRLPHVVEQAAYSVICEAITNAIKHANAKCVTVKGRVTEGVLHVKVMDDGDGGAHVEPGRGLAERCDEVYTHGGTLNVKSDARGTCIEARIPCE